MTVTNANAIVQESEPRGRFFEANLAVGQTPKPGQCIHENSDGTWSAGLTTGADGDLDLVAVLCENIYKGQTSADAYADEVSGTTGGHFYAYIPAAGDRLTMLIEEEYVGTGTAETISIGDFLMIDHANGKLKTMSGTPLMKSFKAKAALTVQTLGGDQLLLVQYTGH